MKKLALALAVLLMLSALGGACAEEEENRLSIAFGLFSVALPEGTSAGPNTGNALSEYRFEAEGALDLIYANAAPAGEYADTAGRKLNSYLSLVCALSGGNYSETEIAEETLENGVRLRWQFMRGDALHTLCFEAFDDLYGYNLCMECSAKKADDEAMLAVMRSFRADAERERDIIEIRQTELPDGAFVSAEHGLQIRLTEEWSPVPYPDFLLPQTAFVLEKGQGRWMIQLLYTNPVSPEDARGLLDWFLQAKGAAASEPYAVTLEGLGGKEAWVAEESAGVDMLNVAFVHEGYGYYGLLMYVKDDAAQARPFMLEALRTITAP